MAGRRRHVLRSSPRSFVRSEGSKDVRYRHRRVLGWWCMCWAEEGEKIDIERDDGDRLDELPTIEPLWSKNPSLRWCVLMTSHATVPLYYIMYTDKMYHFSNETASLIPRQTCTYTYHLSTTIVCCVNRILLQVQGRQTGIWRFGVSYCNNKQTLTNKIIVSQKHNQIYMYLYFF